MSGASGFQLLDKHGNAVTSRIEYFLKMANPSMEEDILSFGFQEGLWGIDGVYGGEAKVTCEFINGITYLKHGDQFVYVTSNGRVPLMDEIPARHQRLRLVVSDEDNTFQLSMWDRDVFGDVDWYKCTFGPVVLYEGNKQADSMKLILSPV